MYIPNELITIHVLCATTHTHRTHTRTHHTIKKQAPADQVNMIKVLYQKLVLININKSLDLHNCNDRTRFRSTISGTKCSNAQIYKCTNTHMHKCLQIQHK